MQPKRVLLHESGITFDDCWIHDESDIFKAQILTRLFDDAKEENHLPRPFGVFYAHIRPCYEEIMFDQITKQQEQGIPDINKIISGKETWTIA